MTSEVLGFMAERRKIKDIKGREYRKTENEIEQRYNKLQEKWINEP